MKSLLTLAFTFALFASISGQNAIIGSQSLLRKNSSNIFVTMSESLDPIYRDINTRRFPNRGAKLQAMTRRLQQSTSRWHQPVLRGLRQFSGIETKSYWATNQIYVKNATPRIITYLRGLPNVRRIDEEIIIKLDRAQAEPSARIFQSRPVQTEWGVERIGAEELWERNINGEGIRIGIIDTGARATHEALRDNWAGLQGNGWFDAYGVSATPVDRVGHGTHVTGTAAGRLGIGVAPNSTWLHCRACDYDIFGYADCPQNTLLTCGQWTLCPTDPQGNNRNCSLAPHVVNNSWQRGVANNFFNGIITAWIENDITPVFGIGNSGPNCWTARSPGDQAYVISVGATNITDTVSTISSRGPSSQDGTYVPIIVAPGEGILSAYHESDTAYVQMIGTSMASPHVAGSVALLKTSDPNMAFERVLELILPTTDRRLGETDLGQCDDGNTEFPNNVAGFGRINIAAAYERMEEQERES